MPEEVAVFILNVGASFVALKDHEHFSAADNPATDFVTALPDLSAIITEFVPPHMVYFYLQLIKASSKLSASSEHHHKLDVLYTIVTP